MLEKPTEECIGVSRMDQSYEEGILIFGHIVRDLLELWRCYVRVL